MDNLSIPELVITISTEILLDTTTASVEASGTKKDILAQKNDISNPFVISFFNHGGTPAKNPASI